MSASGGWIQRIDATPFHFKLAHRNGMHTKACKDVVHAKAAAELRKRWRGVLLLIAALLFLTAIPIP
jgi:hypothetical protein